MNVPIPTRKPDFSSGGNADGFLTSILSTVENVSNSAFKVSGNVARIKQLFDGGEVPAVVEEVPPSVNNPTSFINPAGNMTTTTIIGAGLALVGLMFIIGD